MIFLDRLHDVLIGVIDASQLKGESFSVGSPENDDCVKVVVLLEGGDVLANLIEVKKLVVAFEMLSALSSWSAAMKSG